MILDGVVDVPNTWISYKVTSGAFVVQSSSHLYHQWSRSSFADSEKSYSGLTDACAAAGRAGCKLIEFIGDGASGDDVKALLNNVHDVVYFPSRLGDSTNIVSFIGDPPTLSRRS